MQRGATNDNPKPRVNAVSDALASMRSMSSYDLKSPAFGRASSNLAPGISSTNSNNAETDGVQCPPNRPPTPKRKTCSHCKTTKPIDGFNRDRTKRDGRQALCRECQAQNYHRGRNKQRHNERAKAYKAADPARRAAHRAVEFAIKDGRLQRGPCEICGGKAIDAHHHLGYDHPLEVQWLCRACHVNIEPRRGREAAHADYSVVSTGLLIAALVLIAVMLGKTLIDPPGSMGATPTQRSPIYEPDWWTTSASWYAPTGNSTSCGKPMTRTSWHVAALTPGGYQCGRPLTICNRRHCVSVRVEDRGAWRSDNRLWDLTPRVRTALHCASLCTVKWHSGWTR